jgi:pyruvate formate lyase activating enzyme
MTATAISANDAGLRGRVFDIQRYSTHDGPGIRTTLFLKGCFLSCAWCHNPESISPKPELMFDPGKCILDLACVTACQHGAITFADRRGTPIPVGQIARFKGRKEEIGGRLHDTQTCVLCGSCVDVCFAGALELVGRDMTISEAVTELERDRPFYERSGGGITASGGEPLYQLEFVRALLSTCQAQGLHTALDTSAFGKWENLESVLAHTDLVLLDLKLMDPGRHRQYTGVDNRPILDNARALAAHMRRRTEVESAPSGKPENQGVWVRVPVVPTINDSQDDIRDIARFVRDEMAGTVKAVELLGYHQLGGSKYQRLGRQPPLPDLQPPSREHLQQLAAVVREEVGEGVRVATR